MKPRIEWTYFYETNTFIRFILIFDEKSLIGSRFNCDIVGVIIAFLIDLTCNAKHFRIVAVEQFTKYQSENQSIVVKIGGREHVR